MGASSVTAAQFVVTTTDDSSGDAADCYAAGALPCSLRDAIAAANAVTDGSTSDITFSLTAPATIVLTHGVLELTGDATVTGLGADDLVIDANATDSALHVASSSTAFFTDLTVQNAVGMQPAPGGAIWNEGTLSLTHVVVQNSMSSPASGGAGIYNTGALSLSESTVLNNVTSLSGVGGSNGLGGGIYNDGGDLLIASSTLSGNAASLQGGNVWTHGGTTEIANSSLINAFGTQTGGGLYVDGAVVGVAGSTIAYNCPGGGISLGVAIASGTVTVNNSIVAANGQGPDGNSDGTTGNCPGCTLGSGNLIDGRPTLAPLGDYGGPTPTRPPLPGSAAICAGDIGAIPPGVTIDQRGFPRTTSYSGTACVDAGAVQSHYALAFTVQPTSGTVVGAVMTPSPVVTVLESDTPFTALPATPLTLVLTGNGPLVNAEEPTIDGVATYDFFEIYAAGSGDTLTVDLPLSADASIAVSATSIPFTIDPATTRINIDSPDPIIFGEDVTFIVGVYTVAPGNGFATGTVTISDGLSGAGDTCSYDIASANGCTLTPSGGVNLLATATYPGDGNYRSSIGYRSFIVNPAPQTITFPPQAQQTYVSGGRFAIDPPATASSGLPISYAIDIASANVCGVLEAMGGMVEIFGAGDCIVHAQQLGNDTYLPAPEVMQTVVIGQASSQVALTASANTITLGQSVSFTATVNGQAPTGSVVFSDGAMPLCGGPVALVAAGNSATATCATTTLTTGSHTVIARYSGDANNTGSSSAPVTISVGLASTTVALTASANTITLGQSVTFTATVSGQAPTGSVIFSDGAKPLCGGPVALVAAGNSATATCATTTLTIGSHTVTATYSGDTNNTGSTSPPVTVSVGLVSTTMQLIASPNPVDQGQVLTLTASVSPVVATSVATTGAAAVPTGAVTFSDGASVLGTVSLDVNGAATTSTANLAVGAHTLNAVYSGDGTFAGASASVPVTVNGDVVPPPPSTPVPVNGLWMLLFTALGMLALGVRRFGKF